MPSSSSAAASMDGSVAMSSYRSLNARISLAAKGATVSAAVPVARTQRAPLPSPSDTSSKAGLSAEQMCTSRATWSAVSGASPVIMKTWWAESSRAPTTIGESARVLHANATKPANVSLDSASSRGSAEACASEPTAPSSSL
eukprot:scaffold2805_cov215-Isochrysis_galbana.AAC.3